LRFQLAVRYFLAHRVDEAIPLFQQARSDGRVRDESRLYLGRCFCHKAFYSQAVEILRRGVDELEGRSDGVAFDLNYWLARALEADGAVEEAKRVYGHVIQLDYNFRDARERMEKLVAESES
jgi:tetratricopeptide (TPR) repeat protein